MHTNNYTGSIYGKALPTFGDKMEMTAGISNNLGYCTSLQRNLYCDMYLVEVAVHPSLLLLSSHQNLLFPQQAEWDLK